MKIIILISKQGLFRENKQINDGKRKMKISYHKVRKIYNRQFSHF